MKNNRKKNENVSIFLSSEEAIVLLDWLISFNQKDRPDLFTDQSEKRVLWNLESILEKSIPEILDANYVQILAKARAAVRDDL